MSGSAFICLLCFFAGGGKMELKEGEFLFEKVVAGNKMSMSGKVHFSFEKKKWVAIVDQTNYPFKVEGNGDSSDEAVVSAIKTYLEI